ncbi:E3 ubiquitin-protein ligase TRIM21-like isoform X1 [Pempheris klunzingeri]|uniref:E3 ubiquitin-protein ligase TRIM21-like isoform X1 n=1 Tax=Pempheris klunzingeri TaxID=3127111 RepID=UPI00397EDA4E
MSAASCLLSEDQFLCPICLDVFTDPVSTPCGHNFCKSCINKHWEDNVLCKCPNCDKIYNTRPEMQVNTLVSEMVSHFRASSSSEPQAAKPGEVPCDVCTGTKLKALKSCLVCLVSYCETHLEPHLTVSSLKRHQLIDPVENLEGRMCTKHNKPLELFCKADQTCICILCSISDHKAHNVVCLQEEYEGKKAELGKTEAELQQMIQQRQLKIEEVQQSVEVSRESADRQIAASVATWMKLKESIERQQAEVIEIIREKHRGIKTKAEDFIREMEQEISELQRRSAELEQMSQSEDQLHLLQNFSSLNVTPPTKDWTGVRVYPPLHGVAVKAAFAQLGKALRKAIKKMLFTEAELKTVRQFAVDVTLDPHTAHPQLILSDDGKQVHHGGVKRNHPDNPERFSAYGSVFGKQMVSSGRFYFEVQVKGKSAWIVGVANESVNRKGTSVINPQNGYWTVCHSLKSKLEKVGVFVDYEEGLVCFYDVDAATLMFGFSNCSFTERLFPFFSPGLNDGGKNSAPLIICPVDQTE